MMRLRGLPAGLSRLTSRFDMNEYGVVYAELMESQLDEQLCPQFDGHLQRLKSLANALSPALKKVRESMILSG